MSEEQQRIHAARALEAGPVGHHGLIAIDSFIAARFGKHVDQAAGFRSWAKAQGLSRLSSTDWAVQWDAFHSRAIKGG